MVLGTAADMGSKSSNPEASVGDDSSETILVGSVIRPHGLRGEVKIQVYSDVSDRFQPGAELLLRFAGRPPQSVRIASFRPSRGGGVIGFEGWLGRDRAEALRGARLEVARQDVPQAPEGLYYHFDLVGCACVDTELGDLGRVTGILEDGGGVLLEVENQAETLLIPFVEAFLEEVDIDRQRIRCRLPDGLLETCASKS